MGLFRHVPVTALTDVTQNFQELERIIYQGNGSPEGRVGAPVGALYLRLDGGTKTTLYVKEKAHNPSDATGWAAK